MTAWIAAGVLALVALVHSLLGERVVIRPLLADRAWTIRLPRRPAEKLVRGAWHLTSIAWLGLAAAVAGVDAATATGVACLVSALAVLVVAPWHLAWPLFALAGCAALDAAGVLGDGALVAIVVAAGVVAVLAAVLHLLWATGLRWGRAHVLPETPGTGQPVAVPGRLATLAVAVALTALVALLVVVGLGGAGGAGGVPTWAVWLLAVAALVLVARVAGERRYVGLLKTVRGTEFARRDDTLYTPLVVLLAGGAFAALHLAITA